MAFETRDYNIHVHNKPYVYADLHLKWIECDTQIHRCTQAQHENSVPCTFSSKLARQTSCR